LLLIGCCAELNRRPEEQMKGTTHLILMAAAMGPLACQPPPTSPTNTDDNRPVETISSSLTGPTTIDSTCPAATQGFLEKAMQYGRIASNSAAFRTCIQNLRNGTAGFTGDYRPQCSPSDPQAGASAATQISTVLGLTAKPNPLTMRCDFSANACNAQNTGANACASIGDLNQTTESFTWTTWLQNTYNAAPPPGDPWWPTTQAASIIWHEPMHNYGYDHPLTCASSPGYSYQQNTVPYIVGNCMQSTLSESGKGCGSAGQCGPDQLPIITTPTVGSRTCTCVQDPRASSWFDATNTELTNTGWPVPDVGTTSWAQAHRAAYGYCRSKLYKGGQLNGWQSQTAKGTICYGSGVYFDVTQAQRNSSAWTFSDVNVVPWAQAARAAHDLCLGLFGFQTGGQFIGHQNAGVMGLVCNNLRSQWFDIPKSDLPPLGFTINDTNAVDWAYAARAANEWCKQPTRGYVGGRLNGYFSSTKLGAVCYR
jgi:hypothetical protein